jgi:hypothetical protein
MAQSKEGERTRGAEEAPMAEAVEGIVTEVDEREINTKYGDRTKYRLKVDVNGDSLSFETWNGEHAKFARDLLNDQRMVKIDWEQEPSWKDKEGNERPGARKVNTIMGPLKEAKKAPSDQVWADKDRRIVRQNSWRHACSLASYMFMDRNEELTRDQIYGRLAMLAERIERHIIRETDLEEEIPFLGDADENAPED